MERLAVIYLLKLRYGDGFATRAGGAWRLIFVMALMPWLRRYRLDDGPPVGGGGGNDVNVVNKSGGALLEEGETFIEDVKKDDVQEDVPIEDVKKDEDAEATNVHHVLSKKEEENSQLQEYVRKLEEKLHELGHAFEMDDELKEDILDQLLNPV
jgi:hypothetical protein